MTAATVVRKEYGFRRALDYRLLAAKTLSVPLLLSINDGEIVTASGWNLAARPSRFRPSFGSLPQEAWWPLACGSISPNTTSMNTDMKAMEHEHRHWHERAPSAVSAVSRPRLGDWLVRRDQLRARCGIQYSRMAGTRAGRSGLANLTVIGIGTNRSFTGTRTIQTCIIGKAISMRTEPLHELYGHGDAH
jgi:hypothetical protein